MNHFLLIVNLINSSNYIEESSSNMLNTDYRPEDDEFIQVCFPEIADVLIESENDERKNYYSKEESSKSEIEEKIKYDNIEESSSNMLNTDYRPEDDEFTHIYFPEIADALIELENDERKNYYIEEESFKSEIEEKIKPDKKRKHEKKSHLDIKNCNNKIQKTEESKNTNLKRSFETNKDKNNIIRINDAITIFVVKKESKSNLIGNTKIIQYSHIKQKNYNFLNEFQKLTEKEELNATYRKNLSKILNRKFEFTIPLENFLIILNQKTFNKDKLNQIANLNNMTTDDNYELNYFECFLLRAVHCLTKHDDLEKTKNFKVANVFIDLLNRFIEFYEYLNKLKEVFELINNNDENILPTKLDEIVSIINQKFLLQLESFKEKELIFNKICSCLTHNKIKLTYFMMGVDCIKTNYTYMLEKFKDIPVFNSYSEYKNILKEVSILYVFYINSLYVFGKFDYYYLSDTKKEILSDFVYLIYNLQ
ncbi:hypothetical protein A0H76_1305 [Hepatospora eriocheir]|uniref:Uncharacterized protein n=1 Tax=Hepatospora eriocheir TaxID=1081669 RepID=A0A1X0QHB3_9MICR|nr:hypothetical protein A0H76_1305 [Hepatospora eriocheir]